MEKKQYSVKDLCSIFNINTNTFPSIARRLNINTEEYCKTEINEFNSPKKPLFFYFTIYSFYNTPGFITIHSGIILFFCNMSYVEE